MEEKWCLCLWYTYLQASCLIFFIKKNFHIDQKCHQFRSDHSLHFNSNFGVWDMNPEKCQISRKNVFNTGWQIAWDVKIYYCINQFRVNLSVNKLIVFYALKIEFCLAEPNHCNNWSVNVKLSKIFAFFVRSLALQHFFLVFVLSMSWQRLRSPTRIVCPTIYSWLKKYAFYTSNTAKQ